MRFRVPDRGFEVILAQGSTLDGRRLPVLAPALGHDRSPTCHLHELHMAFQSFSLFTLSRRFRHSLLALAFVAGSPAWAQQAPATATPTPSRHMIAEIQVLPRPVGTPEDRYKYVDAAIAVIQASGLKYEVHAMGTVVEGPPEQIWPLLQAVHQATLEAGAERTMSVIKVSNSAQAGGPRVSDLVGKFRK